MQRSTRLGFSLSFAFPLFFFFLGIPLMKLHCMKVTDTHTQNFLREKHIYYLLMSIVKFI